MTYAIDFLKNRNFTFGGVATLGDPVKIKIFNLPAGSNTGSWSWVMKDNTITDGDPDSGQVLSADFGTGTQKQIVFNTDWDDLKDDTRYAVATIELSLLLSLSLYDFFSLSFVFNGDRCANIYQIGYINNTGSGAAVVIQEAQLITPSKRLIYSKGNWNASTNTPDLNSLSDRNAGDWYTVSTAGFTEVGGRTDWVVGEVVYYDGETWKKPSYITVGKNNKLTDIDTTDYTNDTIALETAFKMLDRNSKKRTVLDIVDSLDCPADIDFEDRDNYKITSTTGAKVHLQRTVQWRIVRFNNLEVCHIWLTTDHVDRDDRGFLFGDYTRLNFYNNYIENGAYGIFLGASGGVISKDARVTANTFIAGGRNDTIGGGPFAYSGEVTDVIISDNHIRTRLLNVGDELTGIPIDGYTYVNGIVTDRKDVYCYVAAINCVKMTNFIIVNNNCEGGVYAGFEKSPHKKIIISNNTISPAAGQPFARLEVLKHEESTEPADMENIVITNNILDRTKVYFLGADNQNIINSIISGNTIKGMGKYYQYDARPDSPTFGDVSNQESSISGWTPYIGIRIVDMRDSIICNNITTDCRTGLYSSRCSDNIVTSNQFVNNDIAVDYTRDSKNFEFDNNVYKLNDTKILSAADELAAPDLHFDFTNESTINIIDGNANVTEIRDVNTSLVATAANATAAPKLVSNSFNDLPGLLFEGAQLLSLSTPFVSSGQYTMFIVIRTNDLPRLGISRAFSGNNGESREAQTDLTLQFRAFDGGDISKVLQWLNTRPVIFCIKRDESNIITGYSNSLTSVSLFSGSAQAGDRTVNSFGENGGGGQQFKGIIGEYMIYNSALTDNQIESKIVQLAAKYKVELN